MSEVNTTLSKVFSSVLRIHLKKVNNKLSSKNCKKWDSLNHVKLILAIEKKFKIKIKPEISLNLLSYSKFLSYLKKNKR